MTVSGNEGDYCIIAVNDCYGRIGLSIAGRGKPLKIGTIDDVIDENYSVLCFFRGGSDKSLTTASVIVARSGLGWEFFLFDLETFFDYSECCLDCL